MKDWLRAARREHAWWKCKDLRPTRHHLWLAGQLTRLARPRTYRQTIKLAHQWQCLPSGTIASVLRRQKIKSDTFLECVWTEHCVSLRHPRIQSLLMWHPPLVGGGADVLASRREERESLKGKGKPWECKQVRCSVPAQFGASYHCCLNSRLFRPQNVQWICFKKC